jgi:hypothetical protein
LTCAFAIVMKPSTVNNKNDARPRDAFFMIFSPR